MYESDPGKKHKEEKMNAIEEILRLNGRMMGSIKRESFKKDPLKGVIEKLVGALIALESGKLFGIVPELDSYRKVRLAGDSFKETWLRQNMTQTVIEDSPEEVVELCLTLTQEKGIRHLPVVAGGQLIGIISMEDLANAVLMEVVS
jgi:CBS domain-containing protein